MYELTVKTRRDLERATLRAQAQKPRIVEVAYGMYKVYSTNPATPLNFYYTGIEAAPDGCGGYSVCCSCPTTRFLCKHVAACFGHFLMRENEYNQPTEAALEAAQEPVDGPFCSCGADANVWTGSEWLCWTHVQERAAAEDKAAAIAEAERLYPDLLEPIYHAAKEYTEANRAFDTACLFG